MKKVVSATLAGALAVGMVPAMALADDAVELQTAVDVTAINNGVVSKWVLSSDIYATPSTGAVADYAADGKVHYVIPTEIDPDGAGTDPIAIKDGNFTIVQYKVTTTGEDIPGTLNTLTNAPYKGEIVTNPTAAGDYFAVAVGQGDYAGAYVDIAYKITANALGTVSAVDLSDLDGTFNYTGNAQKIGFTNGTDNFVEGVNYTVEYYSNNVKVDSIVAPGTYKAVVKGIGNLTGSQDVAITVGAMDLSEIAIADQQVGSAVKPTLADVEGLEDLSSAVLAELELVAVDTWAAIPGKGTYTFKVQPKAGASVATAAAVPANSVEAEVYTKVLPETAFLYDGVAITEKAVKVSNAALAAGQVVFDASKIAVMNGVATVDSAKYDIAWEYSFNNGLTWTKAENTGWSIAKGSTPGIYKITVKMDDSAFELGGESATVTYTVVDGALDLDATCYVTQNGKIASALSFREGSVDIAGAIEVKSAGATLTQGTDYALVYYKKNADGTWTALTGAPAVAGEYKVQITSVKYDLSGASEIPVTIYKPITFDVVRAGDADAWAADGTGIYVYEDDKEIVPAVEYLSDAKNPATALDDVYTLIPEGNYTLKYRAAERNNAGEAVATGGWLAKVEKPGLYMVYVYDMDSSAYDALNAIHKTFAIEVVNDGYLDVDGDDWFAGAAFEAKQLGLMFGYGNGAVFGPYDNIIRGDFAMVVSRLAGKQANPNLENRVDYNKGWDTGFADVPESSYYAQAIAYVDSIGVFTGYDNGKFGAEDELTREQAATVLYRLACKSGAPKVDATVLAAYADAGEISSYAKTAMAWCVQEGIFGVNTAYLNPGDTITRAETAAVVTRF